MNPYAHKLVSKLLANGTKEEAFGEQPGIASSHTHLLLKRCQ